MEVDTLFKHLFSSQSNNLDQFGAVSFVIYETKFLLVKTWEKIISSFTFFVSRKYGRKEYKDGIPLKSIDLITSNLWHGLYTIPYLDSDVTWHHGPSGWGPSRRSTAARARCARILFVANAIDAVPTIAPATPHPMATARPELDALPFGIC